MRVPTFALRETISIQDFRGSGSHGPVYADARVVRASVQETSRLVTDTRGRAVTLELLAQVRPESGPVLIESRVAWQGRVYRVVTAYASPDTRRPTHWELGLSRFVG